nr:hypothetical protein [Lacticaseibacillus saniviri]
MVFLIFSGRFIYIAVAGHVDSANLQKERTNQYQTDSVLRAKRGTIYDRNGNVVAESSNTYTIYAILDKSR